MEPTSEAETLAPVHLPRITIRFCTQLSSDFLALRTAFELQDLSQDLRHSRDLQSCYISYMIAEEIC